MTRYNLPALARSPLSRRGVLQGAAAIGAAGLILPGTMGRARAQTRGGTFRIGLGHGSTGDSYDPGLWDNLYAQTYAAAPPQPADRGRRRRQPGARDRGKAGTAMMASLGVPDPARA